jgi:hypothetical protein
MSLYTDLVAAGCEVDSHYSDLYVLDTELARSIIAAYIGARGIGPKRPAVFRSAIDSRYWIDLPFLFDPFWERKS